MKSISRKFIIHKYVYMPLCTHLHWYIETSFCCSSSPPRSSWHWPLKPQNNYKSSTKQLTEVEETLTLWPSSSRQEMRIATTKNCIFGFLVRDHQDDGGWPFNVVWHTGEKYDENLLIQKMILFLIFLHKQYFEKIIIFYIYEMYKNPPTKTLSFSLMNALVNLCRHRQ